MCALFSLTQGLKLLADESIGDVSELNGNAQIVRDEPLIAEINLDIQQDDTAITKNGRMGITFLDSSQVWLTEYSQLKVTKYVYDPNPDKAELGLKFTLGTARFLSSKLNNINNNNIKIETPTAFVGINGTDFTMTINELGETLVILLPDEFGLSSGEIEVITGAGSVILNQPFQATTVSVFENTPSRPVFLDITLELIDNLLIVSPPKEQIESQETQDQTKKTEILTEDDLDFDFLAEDFLESEDLDFAEIDYDALDINFLEDLLDIIDELAIEDDEDVLAEVSGVNITGTNFGQDSDTQITTFITDNIITLQRSVAERTRLDLAVDGSYSILLCQDGVCNNVKINGGSSTIIKIIQSDG